MANYWSATALHEELAAIYRRSPGITTRNSLTESLWKKIEEVEHEETLARAARKLSR